MGTSEGRIHILTGDFFSFARCHRYHDGPFCTSMQFSCVFKVKIVQCRTKILMSDEAAKCTKTRQKKQKPSNTISIL